MARVCGEGWSPPLTFAVVGGGVLGFAVLAGGLLIFLRGEEGEERVRGYHSAGLRSPQGGIPALLDSH